MDSLSILKHVKNIQLIRTSLVQWIHLLCNIQRSFDWSGHLCWEIRGSGLTHYGGTCKGCLSDQNILAEKPEGVDSPPILEQAEVVWVLKTSLLRNERDRSHLLYWNMQRLFGWSGHCCWEIRSTGLTSYVGMCKGCSFISITNAVNSDTNGTYQLGNWKYEFNS